MTAKIPHSEPSSTLLLGIETSGVACAVGVSRGKKLLGEISAGFENIHSEKLAPFFQQVLQTTEIDPADLHAIVLSAGPGSFTGLRIGYSFAKGLAYATGVPLVEVSTLDVWAYQSGPQALPLLSLIDAHRGEVFCAAYHLQGTELQRDSAYQLVAVEDLSDKFSSPVAVCGADSLKLRQALETHLPAGSQFLVPASPVPQMWALLDLGRQKYQQAEFADLRDSEPFYLRAFRGVS